jgi:hypothetical protein
MAANRDEKRAPGRTPPRTAANQIKSGQQPWFEVNAWRLELHKQFDAAFASTKPPERPDYGWVNEFLLKARMEMVS